MLYRVLGFYCMDSAELPITTLLVEGPLIRA